MSRNLPITFASAIPCSYLAFIIALYNENFAFLLDRSCNIFSYICVRTVTRVFILRSTLPNNITVLAAKKSCNYWSTFTFYYFSHSMDSMKTDATGIDIDFVLNDVDQIFAVFIFSFLYSVCY